MFIIFGELFIFVWGYVIFRNFTFEHLSIDLYKRFRPRVLTASQFVTYWGGRFFRELNIKCFEIFFNTYIYIQLSTHNIYM